MKEYFNRKERRKYFFKKSYRKRTVKGQTWDEFNGDFIKKRPYKKLL